VSAVGGSTNAVLHLLAIAAEARVELTIDDFDRIARRVPHIADTKPGGRYVMNDLDRIGGVPVVLRELLEAGLLHGDALTVSGRTMAEEIAALDPPAPDGVIVHPITDPIHADGGMAILRGTLAPEGAVVKVAGIPPEQLVFEGPARVFDGEQDAMAAVLTGGSSRATSSSSATRARRGGPGHAGDARRHLGDQGRGARLRGRAADRWPLLRRDARLLHRARRTRGDRRWTHRLVAEGDRIRIDVPARSIELLVDESVLAERRTRWSAPEPRYTSGVLWKYARTVGSASTGATTGV
jgi:dihydroxy-acid dehydratase